MKPKITEAWERLGAVAGTRYDLSRWSADRTTLWVALWSDGLKRVDSGLYRYTLCESRDLVRTTGERHHANVHEAIKKGVPIRGFLVWPKKAPTAQGHRGIEDVDATRQYEIEVESHDDHLVVALARGI